MGDPRIQVARDFLGEIEDSLRENIKTFYSIFSDNPPEPGYLEDAITGTLNEVVNKYGIHCEYRPSPILITDLSEYGRGTMAPPTPRRPTAAFSNLPPLLSLKSWDGASPINRSRIGWQPGFEGAIPGQRTIKEMFSRKRPRSSGGKRRATRRRR